MPCLSEMMTFLNGKDHALYDLSLEGAKLINDQVKTQPSLYYYSYSACVTEPTQLLKGKQLPSLQEWKDPVLALFAAQMGLSAGKISQAELAVAQNDPLWLENDGAVPVASALYPAGEPHQAYTPAEKSRKGVWHVMPTLYGRDHGFFCGADINNSTAEDLKAFYMGHFAILEKTY
jgi:triacylglycerol lipase